MRVRLIPCINIFTETLEGGKLKYKAKRMLYHLFSWVHTKEIKTNKEKTFVRLMH